RKIDTCYPRVWRRARDSAGVDVNSLSGRFDHKRKRLTHTPIRRFDRRFFALAWRWWTSIERNLAEEPVVLCCKSTNRPRADLVHARLFRDQTFVRRNSEGLDQSNLGWSGNDSRTRAPHDFGTVKQMIKMRVRDEKSVRVATNMFQTFADSTGIRLNRLIQCCRRKSDSREIGIDQQNVPARFKLKAINAKISDTDRV